MTLDEAPAPTTGRAAPRGNARLSRRAAFRLIGTTLLLMLFSSAVPSPLYVMYQQDWHFSPTMLTVVFGVYALVVLASLWLFGSLSDTIGRRPVLVVALLLGIGGLVLFVTASGVGWLLAARVVQGLSVGLATGALSAALIDLAPAAAPHRASLVNGVAPLAGMCLGSLVTGLLVAFVPAPTVVPYLVPLVGFVALAIGILAIEEPAPHAHGRLDLRPRRISIPAASRRPFALLSLGMIVAWAVSGLYLSLVPSLLAKALGVSSHLVAGVVIAVLTGAASISQLLLGRLRAHRVAAIGLGTIIVGLALTFAAVSATSITVFFAGTAVLGLGMGATFLGVIRSLSELAEPRRRGELFAALYVVNYLALSVPAIVAGILTDAVGLRPMTTIYLIFVALVAVAALVGLPAARTRPELRSAGGM